MKHLRKIIREVLGSYLPINDISDRYADKVVNIILKQSNNGTNQLNFHDKNLVIDEPMNENDRENTEIDHIIIDIIPINAETSPLLNKVSGNFDTANSKIIEKTSLAYIKLKLINWDYKTNLKPQIKEVLTHEIFHAFRHFKKSKKTPYYDVLNKSKNEMSFFNVDSKNETLNKFIKIFYLSLPEEIATRIHEAYTQMDNLKLNFSDKTADEVIKILNERLPVFKDFLRIQNFELGALLKLPPEVKTPFVDKFNSVLQSNGYKKNIKNPDDFFAFWVSTAKNEGLKARHKIVSQALNLFSNKTISEYDNKNLYEGYNHQFVYEIIKNLNAESLEIIYDYSEGGYGIDYNDTLLNEIKNYSSLII